MSITNVAGLARVHAASRPDAPALTAAGKILKRELRAPFWEGVDRNVS
jgi:hypothetical protein